MLAKTPPDNLARRVARGPLFGTRDYDDIALPPPARTRLLERFGQYGIVLACDLTRAGVDSVAALRTELANRSGLNRFRTLLADHFGRRADLIKVAHTLSRTNTLTTNGSARLQSTLDTLKSEITTLELSHTQHFQALRVLTDHYDGALTLSPADAAELLRPTGEHGDSLSDRLGRPADAPGLIEYVETRIDHWSTLALDPTVPPKTANAIRFARRQYEEFLADLL
ncbi:hypothetical protein V5P93_004375 [Actinokineospora auranticolor]|uniref:Uncharacterized protein n=1 Tax=Actinokineospora auranticolor TaxID=155976 RepID=A0A2S6GTD7_9PSEU|nr:hypothetical protein [Actinokineospora auranticolor]PPK68518.1 hypothetical protein CLV40_105247 [Actinokineospora auranticolor]